MDDFERAKQFFIEGLRLFEANNFEAAETQFARSLEILPDRVSTLNNLSAIKIRLNKFDEAENLALKATALEIKSPEAWANLGIALAATKRHEEALQAYDRALNSNPTYAKARLNKAMSLLDLKRYDEALLACDEALKLNPGQYDVLYTKSLILKELNQPDEAQKVYLKSIETKIASSPVVMAERHSTQKADVLIISPNPSIDNSLTPIETLHRHCPNFPGQVARIFQEDFHFSFVFEGVATKASTRKQIPQPDFVINNFTNGEQLLSGGSLLGLIQLMDSFGVPVVNHPSRAIQTTRDASIKLLDNVPGIRIPKTMRFSSAGKTRDALVHEIEDQYDYPFITRTLSMQRGIGMTKVDSQASLFEVLASDFPENFFVTEFVDSRGGNEFFRKIRAAIIKDEIILVRVDYKNHWNVHGRKSKDRVAFYLQNMQLLQIEKQICANPEKELGKSALDVLREIRDRIPMDVFGVDFDVDADGTLVFYEANATMNLFSTAQKEVPNPKEVEDHLKQAFHRYLTSLVTRH